MPKFVLKYPFFIIMLCLMVALVGVVNLFSMPVDLFPDIDMPVVVATFYNGMPPQQIEADIANTFERFFTLAANESSDIAPGQWVGSHRADYTPLSSVAKIRPINTPTGVDHYQIRRVFDIYVSTKTEALQGVGARINDLLAHTRTERNTRLHLRGAVVNMNQAFREFGLGLVIAVFLVYLILMSQFTSFVDPFIILMAIPPGLAGVVMILLFTGSTLNIMSLMGVIMMTGIVVSNSILIVEFSGILHEQGMTLLDATVGACKVRLGPIRMTSLATLLGMIPMALGFEAGSERYAPLARAVIAGLGVSVAVTVFLVPAVYLVIHTRRERRMNRHEGAQA